MPRPIRDDQGTAGVPPAELSEEIGFARGSVQHNEQELARLRALLADLQRQVRAVELETADLERELVRKLAVWRRFDEQNLRADEILPEFRAVTGSITYRAVRLLQRAVDRGWALLTLRAFRR